MRLIVVILFGGSVNARRVKQNSDPALKKEPSEICKAFARNLRAAREEAGLSRARLADAADVSERHIWLIETTALNVTLETVAALAKNLGKTPLELLAPPNPRRKSAAVSNIEN
jgi:ribosome-binding protein aMBF1 (putative translation factor)